MRQNRISINDIKYDLIKIIEPHDGRLETKESGGAKVEKLFDSYLRDLRRAGMIQHYDIEVTQRPTAFTYDISVKVNADRSPKKLKIHVGVFTEPWAQKSAA
jgi:hypothetical protein